MQKHQRILYQEPDSGGIFMVSHADNTYLVKSLIPFLFILALISFFLTLSGCDAVTGGSNMPSNITIDGKAGDWKNISAVATDVDEDTATVPHNMDILNIKAVSNSNALALLITLQAVPNTDAGYEIAFYTVDDVSTPE